LTIRGAHAFEILQSLAVLARALENDPDSFVQTWNPAPMTVVLEPTELELMIRDLEITEATRAHTRSGS
jgi:hypothetical protein